MMKRRREEFWKVTFNWCIPVPESIFADGQWRSMLSTAVYTRNLVAIVVDEAHCIHTWYAWIVACEWFGVFLCTYIWLGLLVTSNKLP